MSSLYDGSVEFKGRGGWRKAHGVVTRGKLDLFDTGQSLLHTVILTPTSKFNNGKTKRKEFHFDIVTAMSEHHFRVESDAERKLWGDYIRMAMKPDDYSKSNTLPARRKGQLSPNPYVTDFRTATKAAEGCYDTPVPHNAHPTEPTRLGSPTDSGFEGDGSGGGQFSRAEMWQSPGLSDDGVVRHVIPTSANKTPLKPSGQGTRSAGSSPFTSPGTSADGTFHRLNKYKWYLGAMTRDDASALLMKEKGCVFGLRENNRGSHVLSIKKLDKPSNSYKVSHHLIKTEGNDYRIDGITAFSGSDILDLLKKFMEHCPDSPPLGGSLSAVKEGMDEEDPFYDYAWDPEQMGDMIKQRLKEQALAEGGEYVGTKDKGGSDKAKYNRAREPWQSPTHAPQKSASQKKQLGRGGAGAEPRRTSTSQQSADNFMADLNKKLGKVKTSEGKGKSGKKPPPPPGKPQHLRPEENQPLYGNADAESAHVYGNVDFGDQIYQNTEFETNQRSGVTKEVPRKVPRAHKPGKPGPAPALPQRLPPTVPPREDEDFYDNMDGDGEIYEDMNADEDEDMYVVPNPGEEEEDDGY